MFVQVIEGQVADRDGLRRQLDRWTAELRPGATGYLGTTAGVSGDGWGLAVARFESAAAARANSERPEQGAWWAETERCFSGTIDFTDSDDVQTFLAGGSDDAGFVQVMKGTGMDRAQVDALDRAFERSAAQVRPDLIGVNRIWTGPGSYVEVAYFTSEADARAGETNEMPADVQALMVEHQDMMSRVEFIDLRDPWLFSA